MNHKLIPIGVLATASLTAGVIVFNKSHQGELVAFPDLIAFSEIRTAPQPLLNNDPDKKIATRDLADVIAKDLLARNPEGPIENPLQPGVASIKTLDPNIVAGKILDEQVQAATEDIFNQPEIKPRVTEKQDPHAIAQYLRARADIIAATQEFLADRIRPTDEFSEATLEVLAQANRKALDGMRELAVPSPIIFIHSEQLRLLTIQQAVFNKILDKDTDPLGAAVAISLLTKVTDQFSMLSKSIETYSIENNIVF